LKPSLQKRSEMSSSGGTSLHLPAVTRNTAEVHEGGA